jgi:hypothetical protein
MSGFRWLPAAAALLVLAACSTDTSRLTPDQEARFAAEGIRFRADNLTFRYSHDAGTRDAGWEDRRASIVVTGQSVLIHKNQKIGIAIEPNARRFYEVHRERDRVRIGAGSGRSRETWSFVPPGDAEAWTEAIRAVIKASNSVANR